MEDIFARTRLLLGDEGMARLAAARVAVFGVGGVGGYAVEALARSGVGAIDLVDSDEVDVTNINRQIIATLPTVGRPKVHVAAERIASINPACEVRAHRCFFLPEAAGQFDFSAFDYVVDAVDTVSAKLALVEAAHAAGVPVISSMGAGNKLDPTAFRVADIYATSVDPLARVMRRELRRRNIPALKVVYSTEPPLRPAGCESVRGASCPSAKEEGGGPALDGIYEAAANGADAEASGHAPSTASAAAKRAPRPAPGSIAFVPSVVGLILGGEVVRDLAGTAREK